MQRCHRGWFEVLAPIVTVAAVIAANPHRARAEDAQAVLDKALKALGGEKLANLKAYSQKTKGTISFDGNDSEFTGTGTFEGITKARSEFEGNFGGNTVKGVTVINGDDGWRKFGDFESEIDPDGLKAEKHRISLQLLTTLVAPLKKEPFKVETAGEEAIDGKPAVGLKVSGPNGKDFTVWFDKESGLPVRVVSKVTGFMGEEFTQEITLADYKDFGGIKKATKITSKRDGVKFVDEEITEFKALDTVPDETFQKPQ